MIITSELLIQLEACQPQLDLFNQYFPDGLEVTKDNIKKAMLLPLDVLWFIDASPKIFRNVYPFTVYEDIRRITHKYNSKFINREEYYNQLAERIYVCFMNATLTSVI